jgi:hypothetical protein
MQGRMQRQSYWDGFFVQPWEDFSLAAQGSEIKPNQARNIPF